MFEAVAAQFDKDVQGGLPSGINVRCGFEAEFASRHSRRETARYVEQALGLNYGSVRVPNTHGSMREGSYTSWALEPDSSIPTNRDYPHECEVISPILDMTSMLNTAARVFSVIQKMGYTSEGTGFHITFSLQDIDLRKNANFDPLKLLLLLGEHYWAVVFGREDADYAMQVLQKLAYRARDVARERGRPVTYQEIENFVKLASVRGLYGIKETAAPDSLEWVMAQYVTRPMRELSLNLDHLGGGPSKSRVEFRLLGGQGYENKLDKIEILVRRFGYALWASCHNLTDKYNDIYARKLWRVVRDTAGSVPTQTAENTNDKVLLRSTGKTDKGLFSYDLEHAYFDKSWQMEEPGKPRKGGVRRESLGQVLLKKDGTFVTILDVVGISNSRQVYDLFASGKVKSPTGVVFGPAELALSFASASDWSPHLKSFFYDSILKSESDPKHALEVFKPISEAMISRYGKLGLVAAAGIFSSEIWPNLLRWTAQGATAYFISGDLTQIHDTWVVAAESYNNYLRYLKAADATSRWFLSSPNELARRFLDEYTAQEDVHLRFTRPGVNGSTRFEYTAMATVYLSLGRNDMATICILADLNTWTSKLTRSTFFSKRADWSFLDSKWMKRLSVPDDLLLSISSQLNKMRENPNCLVAQLFKKASPDAVKQMVTAFSKSVSKVDLDDPTSSWYPVTGIPSLDKILKGNFDRNVASSAKLLSTYDAGMYLGGGILDGGIDAAHAYAGLAYATPTQIANESENPYSLAKTVAVIARILNTSAVVPNNPELRKAFETNPAWQAAFMANFGAWWRDSKYGSLFGIDPQAYIRKLFEQPDSYVSVFKADNYAFLKYATAPADYVPMALANAILNGMSIDDALGDFGYKWYLAISDGRKGPLFKWGDGVIDLLRTTGLLVDGAVTRQVRSPFIASLLKADPRLGATMPALIQLLPEDYRKQMRIKDR